MVIIYINCNWDKQKQRVLNIKNVTRDQCIHCKGNAKCRTFILHCKSPDMIKKK